MNAFLEGVFFGLSLSILVGPLLLALVSTSLEYGVRAGLWVAIGVWSSDIICFSLAYLGLKELTELIENPIFELVLGIGGGILLALFGLGFILGAKPKVPKDKAKRIPAIGGVEINNTVDRESIDEQVQKTETKSTFGHYLKGLLINSLNPFTIVFWAGTASTVIVDKSPSGALSFFIGIMLTLVCLDSTKVVLADKIKNRLTPQHILKFRLVSGIALIFFGVVMFIRVLN